MFRVLLNSGDVIERLAEVDHVILDKTRTLTMPDHDVTNAADIPAGVFALARRLALSSHHPVAAAVAQAAGVKPPIIGTVEEAGQGVRVIVDGDVQKDTAEMACGAGFIANDSRPGANPVPTR
ncbi:cation transport ATPase [Bradyrhizobium sp. RT4a]